MQDIMQEAQRHYFPDDDLLILFGGDQLTEERARNMQNLEHVVKLITLQQLQPLFPKNEDWHLIQSAYDVSKKITLALNCNFPVIFAI